ncbi:DUF805 domain-containing protein [Weissella halotolerans]|uniref:Integral membrane protein n=1 Tax=Weissella halotolerans DSM 20190 TaxID=1123500 RepID=A0A0R2G0Y5_9LACO|nr:DUF805 domain-containing protein [Weissella halotolerans]KRN33451.1 hypothetical protein IV68_GL000251 [Weissella halotolerans DSM 20190]
MRIEEVGYTRFRQAASDFWVGFADFKGRTTRSGFIWGTVVSFLVTCLPLLFFLVVGSIVVGSAASEPNINMLFYSLVFMLIVNVILLLPRVTLTVRRLRDIGLSKWGILVAFIVYLIANISISWILTNGQDLTVVTSMSTIASSLLNIIVFILLISLPTNILAPLKKLPVFGTLFQ